MSIYTEEKLSGHYEYRNLFPRKTEA